MRTWTRNRWWGAAVSVACALAAIGCSGGTAKSGGGTAKLAISASAHQVKPGDTPVAMIALIDSGGGTVSWTLDGPGALSETTGVSNVYTPPTALAQRGVATITASCGALQATVTIELVVCDGKCDVTVSGRVLDEDGNPVTAEAVVIPGLPATATDDAGRFTIPGVVPPYDITVVRTGRKLAFVYRGLTRTDPTLFEWSQADDQTRLADRSAGLTGLVSGGDGGGSPAFVNFASRELDQWYDPDSNFASTITAPGPYSLGLEWNGPETTTGTLLALQYRPDPGSGAPTSYWYAYQPGVTLLSGQPSPLAGPHLYLMPAASDTAQGVVRLPSKYLLREKFVGLNFPGGNNFGVFRDFYSLAQNSFFYEVPDIAGANVQVCARAEDTLPPFAAARSISCEACVPAANPTPMTVAIREAPEPYLPAHGGSGITYDTVFSWTAYRGGIHVVQFIPYTRDSRSCSEIGCGDVPDDAPKIVVITADASTTIPDLRSLGMGLVGGHPYYWRVRGMGPFQSTDDFADYPVAVPPFDLPTAPEPEAFWAKSRLYEFSTCDLGCLR